MKTVLDVTVCTHSKGGVGRWVKGLSKGLSAVNSEHISLDVKETHIGLEPDVSEAITLPLPFWMHLPLLRRFFYKKGLLQKTRADRIQGIVGVPDVIHLSGVQPFGNARKKVVTFFDDTPWTDPSSHTVDTLFYAKRLRNLIDGGASLLTISNWSASVAKKLFSLPDERVGSAGGAVEDYFVPGEPDPEILRKYDLKPKKYFLHVGSFVPRKNIPFLIRCFSALKPPPDIKLVLVGAEQWGDELLENNKDTLFLKNISDKELVTLYRGAISLLIPSSTEGLGLPVLEAFACNTPVISSDGGALPETVGDSGLILPALAEELWVKAFRDILSGRTTNSLREKAASAYCPRWTDVGRNALQFYRSLQ